MKIIAVTGACSNVGKTTLAEAICGIVPNAVCIKIGHGKKKSTMTNSFYEIGTPFSIIKNEHKNATFFVVESNAILREMSINCIIFLDGPTMKLSAVFAKEQAHIVRGIRTSEQTIIACAKALEIKLSTMRQIEGIAQKRI